MARPRITMPASRIDDALIDHLLAGWHSKAGLIGELKKRLAERLLATELDVHLAYPDQVAAGNQRNGTSEMTVQCDEERVVLEFCANTPKFPHRMNRQILAAAGAVHVAVCCRRHGRGSAPA